MDWSNKRVVVTGGAGFLGTAVCRLLEARGAGQVVVPRSLEYDLTTESGTERLFEDHRPHVVLHLAAELGGIGANRKSPGRFFYANMAMGIHLIEQARLAGVEKFVQVGTVCSYPKFTPVPFREEELWSGYPEETNAPYGVAKKALYVMLDAYHREYGMKSAIPVPVNLYGPGDNFDLQSSHVIPALISKCVHAIREGESVVRCWGSGSASREFLYVDDAAEGILAAAASDLEPQPVNLGTGSEITIRDLMTLIAELTGFRGEIEWDTSQPDGQPRRCLDTSKAKELLGWEAQIGLREGLQRTIDWFRDHGDDANGEELRSA